MDRKMISVIVPVYNAENYLMQCLTSICGQTYDEMDIILIDDGSTDESCSICDEYAAKDHRIRVYHTKNQGHYMARQFAIEEARRIGSSYVGFVDADDWIEPVMYEVMVKAAETENADIVECGFYTDYLEETWTWLPANGKFSTEEALFELLHGRTHDYFWNKLWKISCYDGFLFPSARAYADASICYQIYLRTNCVIGVPQILYHYVQNSKSIAHAHDMRLINMWRVNQGKYVFIQNWMKHRISEERMRILEDEQMQKCVYAIGKNWAWWNENPVEERYKNQYALNEMSAFLYDEHLPLFGRKEWTRQLRISSFLARYPNRFSTFCAWIMNQIDRRFRATKLFS